MNIKHAHTFIVAFAVAALTLSGAAWAKKDAVYTKTFSSKAVEGYDVTTYFAEGDAAAEPVKGSKKFQTEYNGADWYFASQENLDKFLAEPEKYAPQYGGYCAWAVAEGKTASGDPLLWTVHDGKLYLNYNEEINERWLADMENFIVAGDENWPGVLN